MIECLLRNGASSDENYDPLILASVYGHADCVTFLLHNYVDVNITNDEGKNCLEVAIDYGNR